MRVKPIGETDDVRARMVGGCPTRTRSPIAALAQLAPASAWAIECAPSRLIGRPYRKAPSYAPAHRAACLNIRRVKARSSVTNDGFGHASRMAHCALPRAEIV